MKTKLWLLWIPLGLTALALACQGKIQDNSTPEAVNLSGGAPGTSGGSSAGGVPSAGGTAPLGGSAGAAGSAGTSSSCAAGSDLCGGVCTALDTANNCGSCGRVCAAGSSCIAGVCTCASGFLECGGTCLDGSIDPQNCGSCGNACVGSQCQGSACICPSGLGPCPDGCKDTQTDNANCGSCGTSCQVGQGCQTGSCQCLANLSPCTNGCFDLQSDLNNCGSCGSLCPQGQVCNTGACDVNCGSQTNCEGSCVDLQSNLSNCGTCGNQCLPGQICQGGGCVCTGGQTECDGQCVNTQNNTDYCGNCTTACADGQSCEGTSCECPGTQELCSGVCRNTQTDNNNCGMCGTSCTGGRSCVGGSCNCTGANEQFCGGACVNTQSSNSHCSSCNNSCGAERTCSSGSCMCPQGETWCPASSQCVNLTNDSSNCGGCGNACTTGQTCSNSMCSGGTGGDAFSQCRFHFGTLDHIAKANTGMIPQLDFFTPGWMGNSDTFDQGYVCDEAEPGGVLQNQVPVIVAYVAAFYVKRHHAPLCDCNVTSCGQNNDLCHYGAQYIRQDLTAIVNVYRNFAQAYANCLGTTKPLIFAMEPDWYQYTTSSQTSPFTTAEASNFMGQFVAAIRQYLPNAFFSMDISPWVPPNNGSDHGANWYSNFNMSLFTFLHTSGGSTLAANTKIRNENNMTWAGVSSGQNKPILADTGYGASGVPTGHDGNWDSASNINARMNDGVVSISQYNANSNWGSTISGVRNQLNAPKFCP